MLLIEQLTRRIAERDYCIGIVGLGYVGLPLTSIACQAGFKVIGFDINTDRVNHINDGISVIKHFDCSFLHRAIAESRFFATSDFDQLSQCDAILIAVPTPLTKHREPDLSFVESTVEQIARRLRRGHLVVLESTTWPGTTSQVVKSRLDQTGLIQGQDYFLAFSPEREDPGNAHFSTRNTPKVVGGENEQALHLAVSLYSALVVSVVPVSSTQVAEAVKLTENIFRAVNIALVNELKIIFQRMGIDIWEVIDAAKTKPFGFMPFYPGPGLGGHCIPIHPFYLTWKAREYVQNTRFIELAGEINSAMPEYVIHQVVTALNDRRKALNGAKVLVLGLAYKADVDDDRESPSYVLMTLLKERGVEVSYYDTYVPVIKLTRQHPQWAGPKSVPWHSKTIQQQDLILIATKHTNVDYAALGKWAVCIVDTRNAMAGIPTREGQVRKA